MSPWRKPNPSEQELLVLACLSKGKTFADLAAGFGIGTATACRYVTETVALPATRSPKLRTALAAVRKAGHAYIIIDGTSVPVDRAAADPPFYSGKRRRHGMNLQVISTPDGDIVWVSGPLPGATHDLSAARIWGKPESQKEANRAHARLDGAGERANAQRFKTQRILRKLRCCRWRAGAPAKAIHVLQARGTEG
jgi:DDE superfamily endonuclease/Helix-turn-helix of DDE superfamily endonuclease